MSLVLHLHPLSSYCQKVTMALYENATPSAAAMVDLGDPASAERLKALWPMARMPVLEDGGRVVAETSIIIEYCDRRYPGATPLIPADPEAALEARFMDRFFDLYVMTPMNAIVADAIRPEGSHDPLSVERARAQLDASYAWLDTRMAEREWAAGDFGLADCAAAPALLYADWSHAIPDRLRHLRGYRQRLLARPSYARALDEARPYRHLFPLGAPTDRD